MGGVVISGLEVRSGASGVTGLANSRGASGGLIGRHDGEALVGELVAAGLHVNARHIPEDGIASLGVLELEDTDLLWLEGQLDRDATAVGVGAPCLGVGATVARDGLHGTDVAGHGPGVDVLGQVVGDRDTAAITADDARAADHLLGKGRNNGGEESGKAEGLGEHHLER